MSTKNTASLSLPKSKTVRGYEIKRLPLGGYLQAVEALQALPGDLLTVCFPGKDLGGILGELKELDAATLQAMIGNALLAAPTHVVAFIAKLVGIDEQIMLDDPGIGLDGAVEMLNAWVEVNNIEDFIDAARKLFGSIRAAAGSSQKPNTGFSAWFRKRSVSA